MIRMLMLVALLALLVPVRAQSELDPGRPQPERRLVDAEFGVVSNAFGLRREVEMAQWRRDGDGFVLAWSAQPVDSSGFPEDRRNPQGFTVSAGQWQTDALMPDGRPLAAAAVEALGEWRPLAPDQAALPANLAATFQPQGDALTTSADPEDPRVGDLRVRWSERVLPPLRGRVALEGGRWVLAGTAVAAEEAPPADGEGDVRNYTPWIGGGLLLIVAVAVAVHRRRVATRRRGGA